MTDGYRALLAQCQQPIPNIDRVRQRLRGEIGVNPGDTICFSMELLHQIVLETRGSDPQWHTVSLILDHVRVNRDGSKVLILKHPDDGPHQALIRTNQTRPTYVNHGVIINGAIA